MAKRTRIELVDDLDGSVLSDGSGETVDFALDGTAYEVDLSKKNAEEFRRTLEDFVVAGRRSGGRARRTTRASRGAPRDYDPKAVRKWAAANKVDVPARGRIPAAVLKRYRAKGK